MYYLKCFILYSVLGFIMESVVYKVSGSSDHSSVLFGPYTLVYGIGGLLTIIINNYVDKLNINLFLKLIILYFSFTIICTLVEYAVGHLIHYIFNIDKWNYTNHKYHFGKYICLDYALIWGLLSVILIKLFKPFLDGVMALMTNNATLIIFGIIVIDLIITILKYKNFLNH